MTCVGWYRWEKCCRWGRDIVVISSVLDGDGPRPDWMKYCGGDGCTQRGPKVGRCFGMGEVSTGPESTPLGGKKPPALTLELVKGSYGRHSSVSEGMGGSYHLGGSIPAPPSCHCLGQGHSRQGSNQQSSCCPWRNRVVWEVRCVRGRGRVKAGASLKWPWWPEFLIGIVVIPVCKDFSKAVI